MKSQSKTEILLGLKSGIRILQSRLDTSSKYGIKTSSDAVISEVALQNRNILHSEIVERFVEEVSIRS